MTGDQGLDEGDDAALPRRLQKRSNGFALISRPRWAVLAHRPRNAASDEEIGHLVAGIGAPISFEEVMDIYVPLSEFQTLLAEVRKGARREIRAFLGEDRDSGPFIVGIAGGVAVGKSTVARILRELLRRGDEQLSVEVLTTDSFLFPNAVLEERGITGRKGFPESYDQHRLTDALRAIRAGAPEVATPVYSHLSYDIVPGNIHFVRQPDILIVEGLNVLQVLTWADPASYVVPSDLYDVSIYVDAAETDVAEWFRKRLLGLRSAQSEPESFFRRFASLSDDEFASFAEQIWTHINLVNLRENVAPTRSHAHLILEKGSDHLVERILLRPI